MADDDVMTQLQNLRELAGGGEEGAPSLGEEAAKAARLVSEAKAATPVYEMGDSFMREWGERAQDELARLRHAKEEDGYPYVELMINTIKALVDVRLSGNSERSAFERPDTCSRGTYYKWVEHEPEFVRCLDTVYELAQKHKDERDMWALEDAVRRMRVSSREGAILADRAMKQAFMSGDFHAFARLVFGIMDRADVKTAAKSSMHSDLKVDRDDPFEDLEDDELDHIINTLQTAAGPGESPDGEEQAPEPDEEE